MFPKGNIFKSASEFSHRVQPGKQGPGREAAKNILECVPE